MAQTKINKTGARVFTGLHALFYKLTKGKVGGNMAGGNIIVLGTTGRRSGKRRERPLVAADHDDGWVVIASFSGHDEHPAWFHNLMADPSGTVQLGGDVHQVQARTVSGDERAKLWERMTAIYPDYDEYQGVTEREIPVLVLERVEA